MKNRLSNEVSGQFQARRNFLRTAGAASAVAATSPALFAQSPAVRGPMVAQIVDSSNQNQDISKDFLVGSRTAWQEINAAGGLRGQTIRHVVLETDGSTSQVDAAWAQLRADSSCLASFGACADAVAVTLSARSRVDSSELAQVAPWLQSALPEQTLNTLVIFSNREQQLEHALKHMSTVGMDRITVVYQSESERRLNTADIQRLAQSLKIGLREMPVQQDLTLQAQQISNTNVPLVLFVGGTPELVQFTRGWNKGNMMRYIIALADVNLLTAQQMIGNRRVPVVGTQAVPVVSSAMPIVRRYRQALAKYYDEPPTALSLAGYISARYTAQVLLSVRGNLNRSTAYEAFLRRQSIDLEGFRVSYENGKLQNAFVTQSMLSADGRALG
jgi:ABC-type branched-subunit amino acid transport system substrate-binding protein